MTQEQSFEEQVQLSSLDNIKADGITIRIGDKIVSFEAAGVQDIGVEEEVKTELREQYNQEVDNLKSQYNSLIEMTKAQQRDRTRELDQRERELDKKAREVKTLPSLNEDQMRQGLTVSKQNGEGYLWSYVCVYAPKYVSTKIIDPAFAKRLMTPIRIFVYVDENWKVSQVKLVKLINCQKFQHYHSLSGSRDCWGGLKFAGEVIDTPDKALSFVQDIQRVLETINRMSIGTQAPKGLSRLSTIEKHLLKDRPDPENNKRGGGTGARRNDRTGFDETVNDDVTGDMWDVNG